MDVEQTIEFLLKQQAIRSRVRFADEPNRGRLSRRSRSIKPAQSGSARRKPMRNSPHHTPPWKRRWKHTSIRSTVGKTATRSC